jgi:hypothetical protein
MFGFDREFRKALEGCLNRISRGDDAAAAVSGYPEYAEGLAPYAQAASTLRGLSVPAPERAARESARRRLLDAVSGAEVVRAAGPAGWLPAAALRVGTVGAALMLFMIAAVGASAFLGGGSIVGSVFDKMGLPDPIAAIIGNDDDDVLEFTGRVISISDQGLALRTEDDVVIVRYQGETEFEWESGEPASMEDVAVGMDASVRVVPVPGTTIFDALTVRLLDGSTPTEEPEDEATPTPTPKPDEEEHDGTPTPKPEDGEDDEHDGEEPKDETHTPTPTEKPSVCTEVHYEGKIYSLGSGSFVLKSDATQRTFKTNGETTIIGFLAAGAPADVWGCKYGEGNYVATKVKTYPMEFWAVVVSSSSSSVVVKIEGAGSNVTLHKTGETEVIGPMWANLKVTVKAYKKADGSYQALRIEVKKADFGGTVTAKSGSTYTVNVEGTSKTVKTNGETEFVGGTPVVGSVVTVKAYRMGDGSYLAYKIIVQEAEGEVFTGVITAKNLEENTIWVDVGGDVLTVCIEFADVIGTLTVGATVEVHVGWVEGGTYFAELVKVLS